MTTPTPRASAEANFNATSVSDNPISGPTDAESGDKSNEQNDADAEETHRKEVVASMRHYYIFFRKAILDRMQRHWSRLSPAQLAMLPENALQKRYDAYDQALQANQRFFDAVLLHMGQAPSQMTEYDPAMVEPPAFDLYQWMVPDHHAHKLSGILHAVARDWSAECADEREACYAPLTAAVESSLPLGSRVLVPGSGLSRLACEVAGLGMKSQGNDFDLFMLFTSSFILNGLPFKDPTTGKRHETMRIHPWLHGLNNRLSHADSLRASEVPDVAPVAILSNTDPSPPTTAAGADAATPNAKAMARVEAQDFSMCAGDFVQSFESLEEADSFDGFISCFFVDTAPNVLEYLSLIYRLLRPGGVWINLGPLQWHWSDEFSEFAYTRTCA